MSKWYRIDELSIEEQEKRETQKRKLHQRIVAYFREGEWECENDDCSLKFTDIDKFLKHFFVLKDKRLERKVFGLNFTNPVGLAAGFDKDAKLYNELTNFGFGFIEIGTLTPLPQDGNPKKRMFRLINDEAIINRMGFNNDGAEKIISTQEMGNAVIEELKILSGN